MQWNGLVYFSAVDGVNGGGIWRTDGTPENTGLLSGHGLGQGCQPKGLTLSKSGYLYFTCGGNLYRTDGTTMDFIFAGVDFNLATREQSELYTTYLDEVAFLTEDDDNVNLYSVEDGEVVLLAEIEKESDFNGLSEVEQGLVYCVVEPIPYPDEISMYVYNTVDMSNAKSTVAGAGPRRLHQYNSEQAIAWVGGEGYYLTNGVPNEERSLFETDNISFLQGLPIIRGIEQNIMVFVAMDGSFGGSPVVYTDGSTAGTSTLFKVSSRVFNFLVADGYAFIADDISNGFEPILYYINMVDGTHNRFYNFTESAGSPDAVLPVVYQNNKLFFFSNLDSSVGRELYSIEVNLPTSVNDLVLADFNTVVTSNGYRVVSEVLPTYAYLYIRSMAG